jgi:hypothetical protein
MKTYDPSDHIRYLHLSPIAAPASPLVPVEDTSPAGADLPLRDTIAAPVVDQPPPVVLAAGSTAEGLRLPHPREPDSVPARR